MRLRNGWTWCLALAVPASLPAQELKERAALTHGGNVRSVAFSGDGKTLASGDANGVVKLWDVRPGK